MTKNIYILIIAFISFNLLTACSSDDVNSTAIEGTFIAENTNDYIKMLSVKVTSGNHSTYAIIHHQLPIINFQKGLETQLKIDFHGGYIKNGYAEVGQSLPGNAIGNSVAGSKMSLISASIFTIVNSNKIKYTVDSWMIDVEKENLDSKPPFSTKSGFLIKADSKGVLVFLKKLVLRLTEQKVGYTLAAVNSVHRVSQDDNIILDNSYCETHFLVPCESLVEIGLLASNAQSLINQQSVKPTKPIYSSPSTAPKGQSNKKPKISYNKRDFHSPGLSAESPIIEKRIKIDPPGSINEKPYPYINVDREIDIQKIVKNATVKCENKVDCFDNAALLIGSDGTKVFQCSATYIGNGYFSSNSHCIPDNLIFNSQSFNKNCSGYLWVKFPETATANAATHNCDKLVMATVMDEITGPKESRDLMIFKVKGSVNRDSVPVRWQNQLQDTGLVTFWPSDPVKDSPGIHGVIKKKTCKINDSRNLSSVLDYFNWKYPISYLSDCNHDIIKGNSGASALDSSASATLVISHTNGAGSGKGLGSNYVCSNYWLDNGVFKERTLPGCRWINDKSKRALREQMQREKTQTEEIEILQFLNSLMSMQDDFYYNYKKQLEAADTLELQTLINGRFSFDELEEFNELSKYVKTFNSANYHTFLVRDVAPINLLTSTGKSYAIDSRQMLDRTGFKAVNVLLPKCLRPLSQVDLQSYRSDNTWNPFDTTSYSPIKLTLPIAYVQQKVWTNAPHEIKWSELDLLKLQPQGSFLIPISTYFEIELSDFYDSENDDFKSPKIKLIEKENSDISSLKISNFWFYTKLKTSLQNLSICTP